MLKADVKTDGVYIAKVSGKLTCIRICSAHLKGRGWYAVNIPTDRDILIKSAAKLRREIEPAEAGVYLRIFGYQ